MPDVSADALQLWGYLPQFVQDSDAANGYLFLKFLDAACCSQLQSLDDLARDQGSQPGWAVLLDVSQCPAYALAWLAQFVGVRFNSTQQDATSQRAAITAESGFARGTVAAIEAAGNAFLSSSATTVIERTPDPYSLTVQAPSADLQGSSWAAIVANYASWTTLDSAFASWSAVLAQTNAFEAAVTAALPGGLVVTFHFV